MRNDELFRQVVPAYMRRFMADFDCSEYDAAAVFGNAGHESGGFRAMQELKPTVEGSRGGYGWFQWTGPRRRNYEAYCARNSLQPAAHESNYRFLFVELTGPEAAAIPKLKKARTTKDAHDLRAKVEAFEMAYERAGIKHYESRYLWAVVALDAYRKAKAAIPPPPDIEATPAMWPKARSLVDILLSPFRRGS